MTVGGRPEPPRHSGSWVGAPVAFLRSRTLRPGAVSIPSLCWFAKKVCRNRLRHGITTLVPGQLRWPVLKCPRMAGFQMSTEGRIVEFMRTTGDGKRGGSRREFWRDLIHQQAQSGQQVRALCSEHGVTEQSFYGWKKRLSGETPVSFALVATDGSGGKWGRERPWVIGLAPKA